MPESTLPMVPEHLEKHLQSPYSGLFGSSILAQVVEEIVSDPTMEYRPTYLEELTGASAPRIRDAISTLVGLGLLEKTQSSRKHPVYQVNVRSKKFIALSLLAYAILDDREGTDCMDFAVYDYYTKTLRRKYEPMAMASTLTIEIPMKGKGITTGPALEKAVSAVSW